MPTEVATVVVETTRTVQIEVPGPAYSNARVAAYLQGILTANGDLLVVAGGVLARVGVGSSGQVLTVSGGAPVWAAPTGMANPMSAQGDLIIGGASGTPTRLPIGTNGQILSVSGSTLAWIDAPTTYTDADAIAAIAGELTDSQLVQRVNANSIQGISLATIYAGAIDAIEALGNGVAVTTSGTLANVTGTNGQVLTHNGTTWVAAAPSSGFSNPMTTLGDIITGGVSGAAQRLGVGSESQVLKVVSGVPAWAAESGMTNPMTTAWDLIRGGSSGAPTRLAVGSPLLRMAVKPDGTLGYCVGGGLVTPGARDSVWYTTSTAVPTTIGSIPWSRVSTSTTSGSACRVNGSTYQINTSAASTNSHATIGATLVSGAYWLPSYATVYQQSYTSAITGTVGLYLATSATVSSNEFFNAPPTANAASASKQGFGLMYSSSDGLTGTWKFIAATTTEYGVVDTGVQWTTDGATPRDFALMIWEGPTAVYGEIWEVSGTPTRLWGGSLPIVSFATTGLHIVAWSLAKTLAASTISVVHGYGTAGYMTGVEAA